MNSPIDSITERAYALHQQAMEGWRASCPQRTAFATDEAFDAALTQWRNNAPAWSDAVVAAQRPPAVPPAAPAE